MNLTLMPAGESATTGDLVGLTPEEIAMCRDALLEAGVPAGVVDRILWTKDRLVRIGAADEIDEFVYAIRPPEPAIASMKRNLYQKIVKHLIEEGIAEVKETRNFSNIVFSLELTVLTPLGWKSPSKVSR